jgi:hypothetical protein
MGAAVPVIGSIIVGAIVSKAVQTIGPKLGLSEDITGIAATIAGAYVGGMTYNSAVGAGPAGQGSAPTDLSPVSLADGGVQSGPNPHDASEIATGAKAYPAEYGSVPAKTPLDPMASPNTGMLTQSQPPGGVEFSQTGKTTVKTEPTYMQRLFSPEKTMDMLMAGIAGYGEAGMAKEDREYPQKIKDRDAAAWSQAFPGSMSQISPTFPSQRRVGG